MAAITEDTLFAFLEHLAASGTVQPKSIGRVDLVAIKSVYKWAKRHKKLPSNPAAELFYEVPTAQEVEDDKRGFYDVEANAILRASVERPSGRLSWSHAAARRWVPWLLAYTGARVNEITQLRDVDVKETDGVWCVEIHPRAGPVKGKKKRLIPVHPHLIEQGFLDFAKGRAGKVRIFYDGPRKTAVGEESSPAMEIGKRLATWVRSLGVDAEDVDPNHGWRHRFKSRAIAAGIEERIVDQIQGHAPVSVGRRYGFFEPKLLFPLISMLPRYDVEIPEGRCPGWGREVAGAGREKRKRPVRSNGSPGEGEFEGAATDDVSVARKAVEAQPKRAGGRGAGAGTNTSESG